MNVLHLFAGAGGGVLADQLLGFRSVGYIEIEPYCQGILKARIADGCIDPAPIFGDVREFIRAGHAREYRGFADVVAGGFPCQPFSLAGKRKGSSDDRNLWPEFAEVVRQVRPRYVFAENVPGLLTWDGGRYFGKIVGDLAALGFDIRWCVLGADDVGAPHRRKRLWILAYSQPHGLTVTEEQRGIGSRIHASRGTVGTEQSAGSVGSEDGIADVADSQGQSVRPGLREDEPPGERWGRSGDQCCTWWDTDPADLPDTHRRGQDSRSGAELVSVITPKDGRESAADPPTEVGEVVSASDGPTQSRVGRVAHGVAHRVDRLRAIGNGQVPAVAAAAWRMLVGALPVVDQVISCQMIG